MLKKKYGNDECKKSVVEKVGQRCCAIIVVLFIMYQLLYSYFWGTHSVTVNQQFVVHVIDSITNNPVKGATVVLSIRQNGISNYTEVVRENTDMHGQCTIHANVLGDLRRHGIHRRTSAFLGLHRISVTKEGYEPYMNTLDMAIGKGAIPVDDNPINVSIMVREVDKM